MILILSGLSRLDTTISPRTGMRGPARFPRLAFKTLASPALFQTGPVPYETGASLPSLPFPNRRRPFRRRLFAKDLCGIIPLPLLGGSINLLSFSTLCQVPGQKFTPEISFEKYRPAQIILEIFVQRPKNHIFLITQLLLTAGKKLPNS